MAKGVVSTIRNRHTIRIWTDHAMQGLFGARMATSTEEKANFIVNFQSLTQDARIESEIRFVNGGDEAFDPALRRELMERAQEAVQAHLDSLGLPFRAEAAEMRRGSIIISYKVRSR